MTTVDPEWRNGSLLKERIQSEIGKHGPRCSLNHIDVSEVEDMSCLFEGSRFNGDISQWNVSKVKNMARMFMRSQFNGDISRWNTAKVINMDMMFSFSQFNTDISRWSVGRVKQMQAMFEGSHFNGDLTRWKVSNVLNFQSMFAYSLFAGDVSKWTIHPEALSGRMFLACPMQNDCPAVSIKHVLLPLVDKTYRGSFNNHYSLAEARRLFDPSTDDLNVYLRETARLRPLDRLHFEKILEHKGKPGWIEKDAYRWVKNQQSVLENLGMASSDIGLWMLQHFANPAAPMDSYALDNLVFDGTETFPN